MLKKVFIILTPIFLLVSCYPAFDMPHYRPHARHYFGFDFLSGHYFGMHGIFGIVIKILIIVALIYLIKILYNKDKNNKKE